MPQERGRREPATSIPWRVDSGQHDFIQGESMPGNRSVMVSLQKQLPWRRAEAGMSARQLAEVAGEGLTRAVIANIECGRKTSVSFEQFLAICRALNANPLDLSGELAELIPGAQEFKALENRLREIADIARI